jgi:hypothetical protein
MVGIIVERRSKQVRRICHSCQRRKARFQYRGQVRADRHHDLCFECFRAERNRQRVRLMTGRVRSPYDFAQFPRPLLTVGDPCRTMNHAPREHRTRDL